jgi:hypothetical protein
MNPTISFDSDHMPRPRSFFAALLVLSCCAAADAQPIPGKTTSTRSDWTAIVPPDVGLYVEFRDLSVTRHHLRRAGLWETIRALAPEAGTHATTQPWQQRTEQLLGMTTEQAVVRLLGLRTALVAMKPERWDRGQVLAELGDESLLPALLTRWQARPQGSIGSVALYRLASGLRLAVESKTLLFAPESDDEALWARTVLLMGRRGGPTLAGAEHFRATRRDLPDDFDGMLYLVWPQTSPSAAAQPGLTDVGRLLATMQISAEQAVFDIRARLPSGRPRRSSSTTSIASLLPADAMAVWTGPLDVAGRLTEHTAPEDARASILAFLGRALLRRDELGRTFLESLSDSAAVVVGRHTAEGPAPFDQPDVTLVIQTDAPEQALAACDAIARFTRTWLTATASDPTTAAEQLQLEERRMGELDVRVASLGRFLAERTRCPLFPRIEFAWAVSDQWLLFSSCSEHLTRVAEALAGRAPRLSQDPALTASLTESNTAEWAMLRGSAVAGMLATWLDYLKDRHPEALTADFWSDWARRRSHEQQRLGLGLRDLAGRPNQAEVVEVLPNTPASRLFRPGDVIVAVNGEPLSTTQPARQVADRYRSAVAGASEFRLTVRRGRSTIDVPMTPGSAALDYPATFDAVGAIRVLIALIDPLDVVTFRRRSAPEDHFDAEFVVRWKSHR